MSSRARIAIALAALVVLAITGAAAALAWRRHRPRPSVLLTNGFPSKIPATLPRDPGSTWERRGIWKTALDAPEVAFLQVDYGPPGTVVSDDSLTICWRELTDETSAALDRERWRKQWAKGWVDRPPPFATGDPLCVESTKDGATSVVVALVVDRCFVWFERRSKPPKPADAPAPSLATVQAAVDAFLPGALR